MWFWSALPTTLQTHTLAFLPLRGGVIREVPYAFPCPQGLSALCTSQGRVYGLENTSGLVCQLDATSLQPVCTWNVESSKCHTNLFHMELAVGTEFQGGYMLIDGAIAAFSKHGQIRECWTLLPLHNPIDDHDNVVISFGVHGSELLVCMYRGSVHAFSLPGLEQHRVIVPPTLHYIRLMRIACSHVLMCTSDDKVLVYSLDGRCVAHLNMQWTRQACCIWDLTLRNRCELVVVYSNGLMQTARVNDGRPLHQFGKPIHDLVYHIGLSVTVLPNGHVLVGHTSLVEFG